MLKKVIFIFALAWLTLGDNPSLGAVVTAVPPQKLYLQIYIKMSDALRLEKQGDLNGALTTYRDCQDDLSKLKERFPHWEEKLVDARTLYLKEKVAKLGVGDSDAATPPVSSGVPQPQQLYLEIYMKMSDALRLEKQGDLNGALATYCDGQDRLAKLKDRFPHWEEALVDKRTLDLKERIAELGARVHDAAAFPSPSYPSH